MNPETSLHLAYDAYHAYQILQVDDIMSGIIRLQVRIVRVVSMGVIKNIWYSLRFSFIQSITFCHKFIFCIALLHGS